MARTIKTDANAQDIQLLITYLNDDMVQSMEVNPDVNAYVDTIIETEEELGVKFTNRQVVKAYIEAANQMVASFIDNAHSSADEDDTPEDVAKQVAYFQAMRPSDRRRAELRKLASS